MPGQCNAANEPCTHPAPTYYRFRSDVDVRGNANAEQNAKLWTEWFARHGIEDECQIMANVLGRPQRR